MVAIGGASLLITDLGGDTQGEVAPAMPDDVDGTQRAGDDGPPEYLDGLILVATYDVTPVDTRTEEDELVVPAPASDGSTQVYALSWCDSADGSGAMVLVDDEVAVGAPCADTSDSSTQAEPLPRGAEHYLLTVTDEPTTVALYVEHTWDTYPPLS